METIGLYLVATLGLLALRLLGNGEWKQIKLYYALRCRVWWLGL